MIVLFDKIPRSTEFNRANLCRVQQPEPEVRHSEVIRTSSLAQSPDHVPDLVVSPASPYEGTPPKEFAFETVIASSPPPRKGRACQ